MTIKNKLAITIVFVFLIVIAILGYIFLSSIYTNLVIKENDQTAERAADASNVIAQMLNMKLESVNTLADFLGETGTKEELEANLTNIEYLLKVTDFDYYAIQWYGDWHCVTERTFTHKKPITGYPGLSGRAVFGSLYKNETEGVLLFQNIFDTNGTMIGLIAAKLPAEAFWDNIKSADIFTSENIMVTKQYGNVLFPSQYAGGQLTDIEPGKICESRIVLRNDTTRTKSLTVQVANAQMKVTAFVNNDEIISSFNSIIFIFIVVVAASIIVIGTLVYLVTSRMTRAITNLSKYVAQMDADCDRIPEEFTKRADEAGKLANSFSLLLSRLNASLDETEYIAKHDSLTLLKNRYSLENDIAVLMKEQQTFAFALLDVDDFKVINDSKGHDEGDRLLKDLASVFRTFEPSELTAYRWGGDEFALIIYGKDTADYDIILKQIMERVQGQFDNKAVSHITVSIGVCVYPESAMNYKDLLINADKALAFAKMGGKENFCFYRN